MEKPGLPLEWRPLPSARRCVSRRVQLDEITGDIEFRPELFHLAIALAHLWRGLLGP